MNLYSLAHHPEAFKDKENGTYWWGDCSFTTQEQFNLLSTPTYQVDKHKDENEFRMHLLFAWWAALSD